MGFTSNKISEQDAGSMANRTCFVAVFTIFCEENFDESDQGPLRAMFISYTVDTNEVETSRKQG